MPMMMPAGATGTNTGDFLGRIEYDARVGFWKIVKRFQQPDGSWADDRGNPFQGPTFAMDFGTLQAGWISFAGTPEFRLKPYGQPVGEQPADTFTDNEGKTRPKFSYGIRVKVAGKVFGDGDAYYWTANSKMALSGFEELFNTWEVQPEAIQGKIPVVACVRAQEMKTGRSTFYKPVFEIRGWIDRLPVFGERTVPPPGGTVAQAAPAPQPAAQTRAAAPAEAMPWDEAPKAASAPRPAQPATAPAYEF